MITSMVAFSIIQLVQRLWQPLQTFIKYIYELVVCRLPSKQNRNAAREGGITIERWNHNLTCVPRKQRNVSFSTMEIRTYESILGDNPSCKDGAPIGIGWNYHPQLTQSLTVDAYENHPHKLSRPPARCCHDHLICRNERVKILLSLGYSQSEIAEATRQVVKVKKRRMQTVDNLKASFIEEKLENLTKTAKQKLLRKKDPNTLYRDWQKNGHDYHYDYSAVPRRSSLVTRSEGSESSSDCASLPLASAPTVKRFGWSKRNSV